MKTYPYAIFDMDGTLLDSMKVWKNLGRNYLELIGIRPPEDLEEHLATMSMLEGAEYFHRELGVKATPQEIIRGLNRQIEDAYRETLVVLDGTTGQNALSQAKQFMEAADITGIILTKLDGTAKGGIAVAIQSELGIPVKYIGIGEKIEDLQKFNANDFVNALFEKPAEQ